jgi:outer membrane protein assembly factor BamD
MPLRILYYCCIMALLAGCATKVQGNKSVANYFSEGEELYSNKKYEESIDKWKKVKEYGSGSPLLAALADLKIADAQFETKNYIEAAATYESFGKFHPENDKAPYAAYRLALCNYMQIGGVDTDQTPVKNAVSLLESFLKNYPASEYAADAKKKLADCMVKEAQHEIYIGRFYYRFGDYKAAIKRLEECVARYPDSPAIDEAFFYLEKAYSRNGEKERSKEAFNRLFIKFPTSKYLNKSDSILDRFWR